MVYESIGKYLCNFCSAAGSVSTHLPLIEIFFRVKLNAVERVIVGFEKRQKLFAVESSSCGNYSPKLSEQSVGSIVVGGHCIVMVEVYDALAVLKTVVEFGRQVP